MNRLAWLVLMGLLLFEPGCTNQEKTVNIKLTNPQGKAVEFSGYYTVESTGDSVPVSGNTPGEYEIAPRMSGDLIGGVVSKTSTTETSDSLKLSITVGGTEEYSAATTQWFYPMPFSVLIEPE